jgi:hypothetical protein
MENGSGRSWLGRPAAPSTPTSASLTPKKRVTRRSRRSDASVVASPLKSVCTTLLVHNTAISAPAACAASTSGS